MIEIRDGDLSMVSVFVCNDWKEVEMEKEGY